MDRESKENSCSLGDSFPTEPKNTASLPSLSPGSSSHPMAVITLHLLCLGACLTTPVQQQSGVSASVTLASSTALTGQGTLHGFPECTRKNIQSTQNKMSNPYFI